MVLFAKTVFYFQTINVSDVLMYCGVSGFQVYNSLPYVYMLIGCVRCRERNKWIERTVLMRKGKR